MLPSAKRWLYYYIPEIKLNLLTSLLSRDTEISRENPSMNNEDPISSKVGKWKCETTSIKVKCYINYLKAN